MNGPRAAVAGDRVAVAWTTGAGGGIRVKLAWSEDGGDTFGNPVLIDAPDERSSPLGRVDLVALSYDEVAVSWLQVEGERGRVLLRRAQSDGGLGDAVEVGHTTANRTSGFPHLERAGDSLLVAWTDPRAEHPLRARRLDMVALPSLSTSSEAPPSPAARTLEPSPLPDDFRATDLQGEARSLRGGHDGPVLVHLWASWCPPCMGELPVLTDLANRHPQLRLVSLAVDDDADAVASLVSEGRVPGVVLQAGSTEVRGALGRDLLPTSLLFDAEGRLVWSHEGALGGPAPELEGLLTTEPPATSTEGR